MWNGFPDIRRQSGRSTPETAGRRKQKTEQKAPARATKIC
jgi:hypothetical protein